MYMPISPGRLALKAAFESRPPSSSVVSRRPEVITTIPVMVQMMIVVKNTLVMEISPWRTQDFVFAAATTMGELPRPASFV